MSSNVYIASVNSEIYKAEEGEIVCWEGDKLTDNFDEANYFSLCILKERFTSHFHLYTERIVLGKLEKLNYYDITEKLDELKKSNPELFI